MAGGLFELEIDGPRFRATGSFRGELHDRNEPRHVGPGLGGQVPALDTLWYGAAGDLDGDGDTDIALLSPFFSEIGILLNETFASFRNVGLNV